MQIKKFIANDMRAALRDVKEELGADAVILSNRTVNDQVEVLAVVDYNDEEVESAFAKDRYGMQQKQKTTTDSDRPISVAAYYEQAAAERFKQDQIDIIDQAKSVNKNNLDAAPTTQNNLRSDNQASSLFQTAPVNINGMNEMKSELKSLRAVIENQQVLSEWGTIAQQHPLRIPLYKRFTEMGLSQDVCKYLVKGLDDLSDLEQAMQAALKQLMHQLPIANDDIVNQGGVYAMVGPTGVGKTTTIAKLAARFAMRHGQRHVALISTDNYRIGAHEQLMTYGRLLGVPVHTANNEEELDQLLRKLYDKKLVLIDTAGMSQRDVRLSEQFAHLGNKSSIIKSYLVLSANAQLATLDESIKSFKKANLAGCILTKLDEAVSLGGLLSAMIKHHLPAAYISHGQRVPEDLQPARAKDLVSDALSRMKYHREPSDEDFMAVAFSSDVTQARV